MGYSQGTGHGVLEHPCRCRDQGLCFLTLPRSCLLETLCLLWEELQDRTVLQRELVGMGII